MARYLVYTSPSRGNLYPIVPTLEELKRQGHEVVLWTLSGEVPLMRSLGLATRAIDPAIERREVDDWKARNPLAAQRLAAKTFVDRARHEIPDVKTAIEAENPDALFVDINCWGAGTASEAWGGPWAYYAPYLLFVPSRDVPPFGPGLPPMKGPIGALRDGAIRLLLNRWMDRLMPDLNALRARAGLRPLRHLSDIPLAAPLIVSYTAEPFEYPRSDWPDSVRMVGPGIWDLPEEPPPWLDEIDKPLVLVTISTEFQNDHKLVQTALEALEDEDVHVVATTAAVDPRKFSPPPNARIERFVPHGPVLERASCVVCHGGMGITQKALAAGVPVCVVPFGRDQLEVARRVEIADAGTRLLAGRLRPDRLNAAVRKAMTKETGAERIGNAFAAAGGPKAAVGALEELVH